MARSGKETKEQGFTVAAIARHLEYQAALRRRIENIAEAYFRITHGTSLWYCDELQISGEIRGHAGSTVMVHARSNREIEDTVNVPIEMIVARNWRSKVEAWALETRRRADRSRKHRELFHVKEMLKKYPVEVRMIVDGKEPEL